MSVREILKSMDRRDVNSGYDIIGTERAPEAFASRPYSVLGDNAPGAGFKVWQDSQDKARAPKSWFTTKTAIGIGAALALVIGGTIAWPHLKKLF